MEDSDKILCIFDKNGKISSFFVKANSFILSEYSHRFDDVFNEKEKDQILEQLWLDVFNAQLAKSNDSYDKIIFLDNVAKSLFFLKLK